MKDAAEKPAFLSNELKLRIVSALVMAVLVLTITWIGGYTFSLLWAVLAFAIYYEYCRICRSRLSMPMAVTGAAGLLLAIIAFHLGELHQSFWIALTAFVVLGVWEAMFRRSVWLALGFAYAILPFFAMSELRGEDFPGLVVILALFGCVWGADIFAYFSGRTIGGPKLAPRISPKKTWSGFLGGMVGALVLSSVVVHFAGNSVTVSFLLVMLVLAVFSQIGDLIESVLKRKFDVKDSGTLIPGHGGVLDRVDGLVVSAVILWLGLVFIADASLVPGSGGVTFQSHFLN